MRVDVLNACAVFIVLIFIEAASANTELFAKKCEALRGEMNTPWKIASDQCFLGAEPRNLSTLEDGMSGACAGDEKLMIQSRRAGVASTLVLSCEKK